MPPLSYPSGSVLTRGLSGPLAFEHDFSALDDPASLHDAAYASESYDFHEDGTPPAPPIDIQHLISRFRSLDLRVRDLEHNKPSGTITVQPLTAKDCVA